MLNVFSLISITDFFKLKLEKVLGFTVVSNNCLDQSCDGRICYLAGCVVVIYDPNTKLQDFIISPARKVLTAVAFSCDGKLIGTGEVQKFCWVKFSWGKNFNLKIVLCFKRVVMIQNCEFGTVETRFNYMNSVAISFQFNVLASCIMRTWSWRFQ